MPDRPEDVINRWSATHGDDDAKDQLAMQYEAQGRQAEADKLRAELAAKRNRIYKAKFNRNLWLAAFFVYAICFAIFGAGPIKASKNAWVILKVLLWGLGALPFLAGVLAAHGEEQDLDKR